MRWPCLQFNVLFDDTRADICIYMLVIGANEARPQYLQ